MKIIKIAARMFDTYGMEDILLKEFKSHYNNFLNTHDSGKTQEILNNGRIVGIGTMPIEDLLQKIINQHGEPIKKNYPKEVTFCLISRKNKKIKGQNIGAFFTQGQQTGRLFIVKVVDNVKTDFDDEKLRSTFFHELQHLFKNMYDNSVFSDENKPEVGSKKYYSKQSELQSFCAVLARNALNDWKNLWDIALLDKSPDKIMAKIPFWRSSQNLSNMVSVFLLPSYRDFATYNEAINSNPELKKKYLYFSIRNLETMLNRYLDELEAETRKKLSENI